MILVGLDPATLVFQHTDRQQAIKHARLLRELASVVPYGAWLRLLVSSQMRRRLIAEGKFPTHAAVQTTLQSTALQNVYSVNDIVRQLNTLTSLADIETAVGIHDVLWEQLEIVPDMNFPANEVLADELRRVLSILTVAGTKSDTEFELGVATFECCERFESTVRVVALEPENLDGFHPDQLPRDVTCKLLKFISLESTLERLDPSRVWAVAKTSVLVALAIILKMIELMKAAGTYRGLSSIPEFLVGAGFLHSLQTCGATGEGPRSSVVLDKVASVLCSTGNVDIRELRTSAKRNSSQVVRHDGATAWRVHVTKGHEALRFMFWRRKDGRPELANVANKHDVHIIDGDACGLVCSKRLYQTP